MPFWLYNSFDIIHLNSFLLLNVIYMTNIIFAVHAAIVSLCLIAEVLLKIWTLTYVPIEMHSFEENGLLPF